MREEEMDAQRRNVTADPWPGNGGSGMVGKTSP